MQAMAKILLTRLYFFITIKVYIMLNSKIDIIKREYSNAALFNARCN